MTTTANAATSDGDQASTTQPAIDIPGFVTVIDRDRPLGKLALITADLLTADAVDLPAPQSLEIWGHGQEIELGSAEPRTPSPRWRPGPRLRRDAHRAADRAQRAAVRELPGHVRLPGRDRQDPRLHRGRDGRYLTQQCRAWGTAIPRPGQPDQSPTSRKNRRPWHVQRYQRHARWRRPRLAPRPDRPTSRRACCAARPRCAGPRSGTCPATRAAPRPGSPPTPATPADLARLIRACTPERGCAGERATGSSTTSRSAPTAAPPTSTARKSRPPTA